MEVDHICSWHDMSFMTKPCYASEISVTLRPRYGCQIPALLVVISNDNGADKR